MSSALFNRTKSTHMTTSVSRRLNIYYIPQQLCNNCHRNKRI